MKKILKYRLCLTLTVILLVGISAYVKAQQAERYLRLADSIYYNDPDSSDVLCDCAAKAAAGNKNIQAKVQVCHARYLILKTDYEQASNLLNEAITYLKTSGDKNDLAGAYNLKSILLERLGNYHEPYEYQNEAVRLYQETGNTRGMSKILNNMANAYMRDKRFKEAGECLDKIQPLLAKLDQQQQYFYYQNRGALYMSQEQYAKANRELETAYKIARDQKMLDSEITAITLLGKNNTGAKNYVLAQNQLNEAEELAKNNNLSFELSEVYENMMEMYRVQEKYKQAFETQTLLTQLKNKLSEDVQVSHRLNQRNQKAAAREEFETAMADLKKESDELKTELDDLKSHRQLLWLGGGLLLAFILYLASKTMALKRKLKDQRQVLERLYNREKEKI